MIRAVFFAALGLSLSANASICDFGFMSRSIGTPAELEISRNLQLIENAQNVVAAELAKNNDAPTQRRLRSLSEELNGWERLLRYQRSAGAFDGHKAEPLLAEHSNRIIALTTTISEVYGKPSDMQFPTGGIRAREILAFEGWEDWSALTRYDREAKERTPDMYDMNGVERPGDTFTKSPGHSRP